jgi:hypothetical protein
MLDALDLKIYCTTVDALRPALTRNRTRAFSPFFSIGLFGGLANLAKKRELSEACIFTLTFSTKKLKVLMSI